MTRSGALLVAALGATTVWSWPPARSSIPCPEPSIWLSPAAGTTNVTSPLRIMASEFPVEIEAKLAERIVVLDDAGEEVSVEITYDESDSSIAITIDGLASPGWYSVRRPLVSDNDRVKRETVSAGDVLVGRSAPYLRRLYCCGHSYPSGQNITASFSEPVSFGPDPAAAIELIDDSGAVVPCTVSGSPPTEPAVTLSLDCEDADIVRVRLSPTITSSTGAATTFPAPGESAEVRLRSDYWGCWDWTPTNEAVGHDLDGSPGGGMDPTFCDDYPYGGCGCRSTRSSSCTPALLLLVVLGLLRRR